MGGGQLGRMFGIAAAKMGFLTHIFSSEDDGPAKAIAEKQTVGDYNDLEKVRTFAQEVDVITFEFENIPIAAVDEAERIVPVRPTGRVLQIAQNRMREKTFLVKNNFPIAPFRPIASRAGLRDAVQAIGLPGVLKTADYGYDGKGQSKITQVADIDVAWERLNGTPGVYEAFIDFEKEISVVGARSLWGEFCPFPVFENRHVNHILDVSFAPADISPMHTRQAHDLAAAILEVLGVVGILTVEMFLTRRGELLVNELAPRTHNSGHLTIDACITSQFEQQVRAICGLPLGSTFLHSPAAMANLLGDLWSHGEPDWRSALSLPFVKLHHYQKTIPRLRRKMGHLTSIGDTVDEAVARVLAARANLRSDRAVA